MRKFIYNVILGALIFWAIIQLSFHYQALIPLVLIYIFWVVWYERDIINKNNLKEDEI